VCVELAVTSAEIDGDKELVDVIDIEGVSEGVGDDVIDMEEVSDAVKVGEDVSEAVTDPVSVGESVSEGVGDPVKEGVILLLIDTLTESDWLCDGVSLPEGV